MNRRKFLVTTGTALLGSTAVQSATQEPAVALNFDLVGVENVQPSSVDSILIDFQNFELVPKYVDETAGKATVTITLDIEGYKSKETQATVSLTNGETVSSSDLGSAVPIVQDNISSSQTALDGSITIDITHPDVSDSYQQSFTITDDSLQDGLVGYWPLHEWSGRANDLSGQDNHGTVSQPIQGSYGPSSLTGYSFDGLDDRVTIPDSSEIRASNMGSYTVSVWVRPELTSDGFVYGKTTAGNEEYSARLNSDGSWFIGMENDNDNGFYVDAGNASKYQWYHIIHTFDGSKVQVYINGDQIGNDISFSGTVPGSSRPLDIGAHNKDKIHFPGIISNLRLYNRPLSDAEIQQLYDLGTGDYTNLSLHNGSDSGAVSRYDFNDNVNDTWGLNDGSDNASGYSTNSIRGKSKVFNGSDDWIEISDSQTISPNKITISFWSRISNLSPETNEVINKTGEYIFSFFFNDTTNEVTANFDISIDGSPYRLRPTPDISENNWYHWVGTYDGNEQIVYLNGVEIDRSTMPSGDIDDSADPLLIGKRINNDNYVDGNVDDVRIYGRSLSQPEVQQLYQWGTRGKDLRERTTTKNKDTLVGWWKLNETSGTTAYDSSGSGNDGIANGAGPSGTGTTDSVIDQSAYQFDSTDKDHVQLGDPNWGFENADPITLSAWAYVGSGGRIVSLWNESYSILQGGAISSGHVGTRLYDANTSTNHLIESSSAYADEWVHVVSVFDGSVGRLYVNGSEVKSDNSVTYTTADTKSQIGGNTFGDYGYFDGDVTDVRLYKRALTPQEVSYLYEQRF